MPALRQMILMLLLLLVLQGAPRQRVVMTETLMDHRVAIIAVTFTVDGRLRRRRRRHRRGCGEGRHSRIMMPDRQRHGRRWVGRQWGHH